MSETIIKKQYKIKLKKQYLKDLRNKILKYFCHPSYSKIRQRTAIHIKSQDDILKDIATLESEIRLLKIADRLERM